MKYPYVLVFAFLFFLGWAAITEPRTYYVSLKFYPSSPTIVQDHDTVAVFIDDNVKRSTARCVYTAVVAKGNANEPSGDFTVVPLDLSGIQNGQRFRFVKGKCNDDGAENKLSLEGRLFAPYGEVTSHDVDTRKRMWFVFQRPLLLSPGA